jgi:hypothetical protein
MDPMMDIIEADKSNDDEVDGDDKVQQPRNDQNENAGDQRDKRGDMGSGDDHGFPYCWKTLPGKSCDRSGRQTTTL